MSRITLRAREHVALSPPLKEMKEQNARRRTEQAGDDQSASSSMPSPRDEHIHSLAWAISHLAGGHLPPGEPANAPPPARTPLPRTPSNQRVVYPRPCAGGSPRQAPLGELSSDSVAGFRHGPTK